MRIAICENSALAAEQLRGWVEQFCVLYQVPAVLQSFLSADSFAAQREPFDIVYMGFGGSAGFVQARLLREQNRDCHIILIDDTTEYAVRGVRLHCTDYILRPVQFHNVVQSMRLALRGLRG